MENNKQTAVDWLVAKLKSQGLLIGEPKNLVAVRQAKEMQRQQIINGRITAPITTGDVELDKEEAEQYYNQEYGGSK